jgi:MFS family permease
MRGKGLILVTLCLAALIINLDITIVNVALPSLVRHISATTTGLQWVVDAYNLVFAAFVLAAGGLGRASDQKLYSPPAGECEEGWLWLTGK